MPVKFKRKLIKVGGSYRVAIPPEIVEAIGLKLNDVLEIFLTDEEKAILIKPANQGM